MDGTDPRTDDELIAAINEGDADAFEALYRRYRDWVAALAYRFTHHHADAMDVLQQTFAYVLRKTPGLRLTARMTTFLYPAVKHLAIAAASKRRRSTPGDKLLHGVAAPEVAPDDPRAELATVIQALPEAQREVVLMRFVDDMQLNEIAEALAIPLGTVKSRLHNALKVLRDDERTRRYFQQSP